MDEQPKWKNDKEFEEGELESVEKGKEWWTLSIKRGHGYLAVETKKGLIPQVGMKCRFYGKGFGYVVRGVVLETEPGVWREFYYRTEEEDKARRAAYLKEQEDKRKKEFEDNREERDAQFNALPEVFRRRIEKFRTNNPDFRWEYEPYEMFCCEQAVIIAKTLVTTEAVEAFMKSGAWEKQKALVPDLSEDHSGNTFGCACVLAQQYLKDKRNVVKMHGALAPLVGSKEYGCIPPEEKG